MFVEMGGKTSRLAVRFLEAIDGEAAYAGFSAASADCFVAADKTQILAIMEAAFGDLDKFNARVKSMFRTGLVKQQGQFRDAARAACAASAEHPVKSMSSTCASQAQPKSEAAEAEPAGLDVAMEAYSGNDAENPHGVTVNVHLSSELLPGEI